METPPTIEDVTKRKPGQSALEMANELSEGTAKELMAVLKRRKTEAWSWKVGGQAEARVGRLLDRLPKDRWTVLHDLPMGNNSSNVDHVVAGPPGVFCLNTKRLTGKLTVYERAFLQNGHKTDFYLKATAEARRISAMLTDAAGVTIGVHPVLVLTGKHDVEVRQFPRDISIVGSRDLIGWLNECAEQIEGHELAFVRSIVGHSDTWAPRSQAPVLIGAPAGRPSTLAPPPPPPPPNMPVPHLQQTPPQIAPPPPPPPPAAFDFQKMIESR